jgi:hypothetical protein
MASPENGDQDRHRSGSEAVAATMIEYSRAPCSSSVFTNWATGRALLTDRHIDAVELDVLVLRLVQRLLVQDGVEHDGRLPGLTIADDQLALPRRSGSGRRPPSGPSAIGSCTDLRGMMPGALTSTRRRSVETIGPLPSIGLPSASTTRPEKPLADRHVDDGAGALDGLAFLDVAVGTEDDDADIVDLEVQGHTAHARLELDHLASLDLVEPVATRDAVADRTAPARPR